MQMPRRAATKEGRFAAFIKHRRESLGLSQADLASACSVTKQAVSQWEVGRSEYIRPKHLVALARILDVSVENLVKGSVKQAVSLTEDEYMLLGTYRRLGPDEKRFVTKILGSLIKAR
jgi:transcriptional regulator with XRE-family HTH domain